MKIRNTFALAAVLAALCFTACENADKDFGDFDGGTSVYFSHQTPVRTLVMGRDTEVDNSVDLIHHAHIYATMGGSYGGRDITVDVAVDNALCDNLYFEDGVTPVLPLPDTHYRIAGESKIRYNGNHWGYLDIELTDAFFADEACTKQTYVIPVLMKSQTGASQILDGTPRVEGESPAWTDKASWKVQPKNYILYCVQYINAWSASYLRRGTDKITENGTTTTVERKLAEWEKEEVVTLATRDYDTAVFTLTTKKEDGTAVSCDLLINFDEDNHCTITSGTPGITVSGSGKYTVDGEKLAWGNKDRDAIDLNYTVDFGFKKIETVDRLVMQTRGTNKLVTFTTQYKK